MRHPHEAVLRRLLDQPAAVADADREHVAGCARCLDDLAATRTGSVGRPAAGPSAPRATAVTGAGRVRAALRRPAVAALAVAAVLTGAGAAAANDWLQIFRTEPIAPVAFSTADLVALPDFSAFGDVVVTGDGDVHEVPDAAAAAAETGLDVPAVTALPRGVTGEPVLHVGGEVTATFTFSTDRAARAAAEAGTTLPAPPPGLDGSEVRLAAGPGVAQTWTSQSGVPSLLVARVVAPSASSPTVPFETARDYLLSLPGVPDDVAAQLRTFSADGSTLPLPVPADHVSTSTADVDGQDATVLVTRDRTMAAVVWVDDGVVTVVAGALDADEVLQVARDLG
jgi:hypothetical protein